MQILTDALINDKLKLTSVDREYSVSQHNSPYTLIIRSREKEPEEPCTVGKGLIPFTMVFSWECCDELTGSPWLLTVQLFQTTKGFMVPVYIEQRVIPQLDTDNKILTHEPPTFGGGTMELEFGWTLCDFWTRERNGVCLDFEFEETDPLITYPLFLIRFESIFLFNLDEIETPILNCSSTTPLFEYPILEPEPGQVQCNSGYCLEICGGVFEAFGNEGSFIFRVTRGNLHWCNRYANYDPIEGVVCSENQYLLRPVEQTLWDSGQSDAVAAYAALAVFEQSYCSYESNPPPPIFDQFGPEGPEELECDALYAELDVSINLEVEFVLTDTTLAQATLVRQILYIRVLDNDTLETIIPALDPQVSATVSTEGLSFTVSANFIGVPVSIRKDIPWSQLFVGQPWAIAIENLPIVLGATASVSFLRRAEPCPP